MAKYQFLTIPASNRQSYTYLDADSPTFTLERNALLAQGFEVEDDFIYANTPAEAVEKYRSNFTYVAEEYAQSNAIYAAFSLLVVIGKSLLGHKRRH
ncbi:hypothetical protein [Aeromonas sp. sif2433]|uniref:hypothetical protein n=1 Tax=Aeromonas sp. sif2433 TaxID=2854794 RepID=UPI001C48FD35|nr:hypothetical protein [Aeromonas sp. sif2433]MBV7413422.1 hypothetical protein [Aeromonas sp. sif2433]